MSNNPMTVTYSMLSLFRNCRKACELRYIDELVPLEKSHAFNFGSIIHNCLELWHHGRCRAQVQELIGESYPNRSSNDKEQKDYHHALAMMEGYMDRYADEGFNIFALEEKFTGKIINPKTGELCPDFILSGKVDGIVKLGDEHYLLEHKTAARMDASYIDKLWTDFQIILYSFYIEQTMGIKISGIVYNVLMKSQIRQGKNETDAEFYYRLTEVYKNPDMFHREHIYITRDLFKILQEDLWELTIQIKDAMDRKVFYRNTSQCFNYGRACEYLPICRSGDNPMVRDNLYERAPAHVELLTGGQTFTNPAF